MANFQLVPALLLVTLLCQQCGTVCSTPAATTSSSNNAKQETFEYFTFSLEWPFTFCIENKNQCKNTDKLRLYFNIHGLWPEHVKGKCHGTFDYSELKSLSDELQQAWMDLKNPMGDPEQFWKHEYDKHGRCAAVDQRFNDTKKYFEAALEVYQKYNITDMLKSEGIVPGSTYQASKIIAAVKDKFGYEPEVDCYSPGKHPKRINEDPVFLRELRICFEKDLKPRDCSSSPKHLKKEDKIQERRDLLFYTQQSGLLRNENVEQYKPVASFSQKSGIEEPIKAAATVNAAFMCDPNDEVLIPDTVNY